MTVRTHTVAKTAYKRVNARRDDAWKKKYGALAHKLPGMILQNGLAQATGFLLAKSKGNDDEHAALLDDLNHVLRAAGVSDAEGGCHLHKKVIASDLHQTLLLTRRSLEASGWLKRYAQGVLGVDATGERFADDDTVDEDGDAR